jgi:hypothetical protein
MFIRIKFTCISPPAHFLLFVLKGGFLGTLEPSFLPLSIFLIGENSRIFTDTFLPSASASTCIQAPWRWRQYVYQKCWSILYYVLWKPSKKVSITRSAGFLIVNVLWFYKFIPSWVYHSLTLLVSLLIFSLGKKQMERWKGDTVSYLWSVGNLVSSDMNCNNKKDHSKYHCCPY